METLIKIRIDMSAYPIALQPSQTIWRLEKVVCRPRIQETKYSQQKHVKIVVQDLSKNAKYHTPSSGKEWWIQTEVDAKTPPNPNKQKTPNKTEEQENLFCERKLKHIGLFSLQKSSARIRLFSINTLGDVNSRER